MASIPQKGKDKYLLLRLSDPLKCFDLLQLGQIGLTVTAHATAQREKMEKFREKKSLKICFFKKKLQFLFDPNTNLSPRSN